MDIRAPILATDSLMSIACDTSHDEVSVLVISTSGHRKYQLVHASSGSTTDRSLLYRQVRMIEQNELYV